MQAAHKKITKRPLTKRVKWFTIIPPSGEMDLTCFLAGTESARKEVGMDVAALCYPRGTLSLQAFGVYCAQFCCLTGRTMAATACSPSFAWQTVVFLYLFLEKYRKEMADMTMPKREVNSIWAKVRDDVDIDDLIFNYEAYHTSEDDGCSDR